MVALQDGPGSLGLIKTRTKQVDDPAAGEGLKSKIGPSLYQVKCQNDLLLIFNTILILIFILNVFSCFDLIFIFNFVSLVFFLLAFFCLDVIQ